MTIEDILSMEEGQVFDRKSIAIRATALSDVICAFANADGGTIAIGISDKTRTIEGVDYENDKLNDLLRVPVDYCNPSVQIKTEMIPCTDFEGRDNHVLLMHIEASTFLHANHADEVFQRIGDKSKKLSFEDRMTLMYDKGLRFFEDAPLLDADWEDIDLDFLTEYLKKIKYGKSAKEYLLQNHSFAVEKNGMVQFSAAAILLFGNYPQNFFPRARVRFIRYDGTEELFGTEMNVIKDVIFEGTILKQVEESIKYLATQIKEKTYLGSKGLFVTEEEYPEFVRQEIIVNAVTHRDYSIKGTDIQIKMFDDRICVESPGKLPGTVKLDNMRTTHFSRNPKIAEFLRNYEYVKEYGEGVDRMYRELENAGLATPVFRMNAFMMQTTIYNAEGSNAKINAQKLALESPNAKIDAQKLAFESPNDKIDAPKLTVKERADHLNVKKINIDTLRNQIIIKGYQQPTEEKLLRIYAVMEVNRVFSTKDVMQELSCPDSTARSIMKKLRDLDVLVAVKGMGKGKYRFKYVGETIE